MNIGLVILLIVGAVFGALFLIRLRSGKALVAYSQGDVARMVIRDTYPLINSIKLIHGRLSPSVYFDYYLMGYIYSSMAFYSILHSGGAHNAQQGGFVLMDVCTELFQAQGLEFLRTATALVESDVNDEFKRGVNDAKKSLLIGHGIEEYPDDEFVNQVRGELQKIPASERTGNPNADLGGLLQAKLFGDYLLEKFGPGSENWSPQ